MKGDGIDLSGAWNGVYSYLDWPDVVTFVALLIDVGSGFSGTIHEYEGIVSARWILLYANLDGRRDGSVVSFLKVYDGTGGWKHSVEYEGTLNGDATEISGNWEVGGGSGKFVMRRAGAIEEAELRKALEPAAAD
jgi:hypothetical protein